VDSRVEGVRRPLSGVRSRFWGRGWPKRWVERRRVWARGVTLRTLRTEVAIVGPEVKGGAVVAGVERVLGGAEVEEGAAVFEKEATWVLGEKGLDGGGDVGGGLGFGDGVARWGSGCFGRHGGTVARMAERGDSTFGGVLWWAKLGGGTGG